MSKQLQGKRTNMLKIKGKIIKLQIEREIIKKLELI
jgi:hypothetical protein